MKVSELPDDAPLAAIKLLLPEEYWRQAYSAGLTDKEVYFHGAWFSGVWLKSDPTSERIFLLTGVTCILEWEVIDSKYTESADV